LHGGVEVLAQFGEDALGIVIQIRLVSDCGFVTRAGAAAAIHVDGDVDGAGVQPGSEITAKGGCFLGEAKEGFLDGVIGVFAIA
jgi:hypothetical protein